MEESRPLLRFLSLALKGSIPFALPSCFCKWSPVMAIYDPVFMAQPLPLGSRLCCTSWSVFLPPVGSLMLEILSGPGWLHPPHHLTSMNSPEFIWVCPSLDLASPLHKTWAELNSVQAGQEQRTFKGPSEGLPGRGAEPIHQGCCFLPTHSTHLHQLPGKHVLH